MLTLLRTELPTFITLFVTSVIVPLFEQIGFPLSTLQQQKLEDWGNVGLILIGTSVAKLVHTRLKRNKAPVVSIAPALTKVAPILLCALLLPVFAGCSLLANPTFDAVLQAVIDVVVGQVLDKNPASAQQIATDATALSQLASGNTATVAQLQTQADTVIAASSLTIADKAAVEAMIAAASGLLAQESTQVAPATSANLQMVFADIANAANLYAVAKGAQVNAVILKR